MAIPRVMISVTRSTFSSVLCRTGSINVSYKIDLDSIPTWKKKMSYHEMSEDSPMELKIS